jgi:hypothetical protein
MTLDPKALLDKATELAERFAADNQRLRALIKSAEFANRAQAITEGWCPWCDWAEGEHGPNCPAFTPDGKVK